MAGTGTIRGSFDVGKDGLKMNVFIPESGGVRREFYAAESPSNFRYFDSFFKEKPVPTLLIRRTDAGTWDKPFVVVYEPVRADGGGPHVDRVRCIWMDGDDSDRDSARPSKVELEIVLDDGSRYMINSSSDLDSTENVFSLRGDSLTYGQETYAP